MKTIKLLIALFSIASILISCKNTDNNSKTEEATVKKELTVAKNPKTATIKIEGMTCAIGCAKTIEENLSNVDGVQKATVDFDKKMATINFDADKISSQDLVKTIENSADGKTYKTSDVKENKS